MDRELLLKNLAKRGFETNYFENIENANEYILNLIPSNASIGFGGSETVKEIGIIDKLIERGNNVMHRDYCDPSKKDELLKEMHSADWYMCSTNALCVSGDLVNIDGRANRVTDMMYGPENVLIVCGTNKIVNNIQDGIDRTRNIAAPINCVKLNKKTPCAITGKCSYCNSPDTICKATVILHHPTSGKKVFIVIVDKKLGF
jgi:hypothetical protein